MTVSIEAWYVWSLIRLEGKKDINYEPPPLFIAHHAGSFMNLKYWPFFSMSSLVIDDLLSPASQLIALGLQDLLVSFPSSTFSYSSSCSESLLLFFSAPVIEMSPWRGFYGSWEILEDLRYVVFYHSSCRSHTPLSSSSYISNSSLFFLHFFFFLFIILFFLHLLVLLFFFVLVPFLIRVNSIVHYCELLWPTRDVQMCL